MTRLTTLSCLLAAFFSASCVLADALPQITPAPKIEKRQANLGVVDNPELAASQVPPVTVYELMNAEGVDAKYTYTQLFSQVPDQWPKAKPGTIGMGSLQKREAEPEPAINTVMQQQPLVLVMETEIVTQPVQRVTEVLIVETLDIISDATASMETISAATSTQVTISTTASASRISGTAQRILPTASA